MPGLRSFLQRTIGVLGLIAIVAFHAACVAMAVHGDEPRGIIAGLMWCYGMAISMVFLFFLSMAGAFFALASIAAATIFCFHQAFGKDDA